MALKERWRGRVGGRSIDEINERLGSIEASMAGHVEWHQQKEAQ
jgi:hypothetical protein